MSKDDRAKLYPRCGKMNPDGLAALARADDYEQVKAVAEYYAEYAALFDGSGTNPGDKTLEDKFFEHEVSIIPNSSPSQPYLHRPNLTVELHLRSRSS